jgi:hypothetical protein
MKNYENYLVFIPFSLVVIAIGTSVFTYNYNGIIPDAAYCNNLQISNSGSEIGYYHNRETKLNYINPEIT